MLLIVKNAPINRLALAHKSAKKQASSRHRVCQLVCQPDSHYIKPFKYRGLPIRLEARLDHIRKRPQVKTWGLFVLSGIDAAPKPRRW